MMKREEEKAEPRAHVVVVMESNRRIALSEMEACLAVEQLLDLPDAGAPLVARFIDEECQRLGITGSDRLGALRRKRAEAQARANSIARNIKSMEARERLDSAM